MSLTFAGRSAFLPVLLAALCLAPAAAVGAECPLKQTLYAGAASCTVPGGVGAVFVSASGGHGAAGSDGNAQGAPGDLISAWYLVGPGQTFVVGQELDVIVGSDAGGSTPGGYGGGGPGGGGSQTGGGAGGGASSLRASGNLFIMAGGGGGGGGSNVDGAGYLDSDEFNGGAGGGVGAAGAQGDAEPFSLDGYHPGVRAGGLGGGGANGGNPGGGGVAFSNYYSPPPWGQPDGQGGNQSIGGAGGGPNGAKWPAEAGGGGGGGGLAGGGGGGGGGDDLDPYSGDPYYCAPRTAAGGGGGGSDFVADAELVVAQGPSTSSGSRVTMRFANGTPTLVELPDAPVTSCDLIPVGVLTGDGSTAGGTVSLTDGGDPIGSAAATSERPDGFGGGVTQFSVALSAGTHTLAASYSGDADDPPGISQPVTLTVGTCNTPTATTVGSTDTDSPLCAPVTLTAVIAGNVPTGTVTFTDGGATIGQAGLDANGRAVVTVSTLVAGSHPIVAAYNGDRSPGGDVKNEPSSSGPLAQVVEPSGTITQCDAGYGPGAVASVPVPADAVSMTVTARGGQGADQQGPGVDVDLDQPEAGLGDVVTATIPIGAASPVVPGSTLSVVVGEDARGAQATTGGGGAGGRESEAEDAGGAGGGATSITAGSTPVLVAAGGGGAGPPVPSRDRDEPDMPSGGDGGSPGRDGQQSFEMAGGEGGGGATAAAAGLAPVQRSGATWPFPGHTAGTAGALGAGGNGGDTGFFDNAGGGGGGGGLYGGGGGDAGGGGGGGSSFVTAVATGHTVGLNYRFSPRPSLAIEFTGGARSSVVAQVTARTHRRAGAQPWRPAPKITGLKRSSRCMTDSRDGRPRTARLAYRLSRRATVTVRLRRSLRARIHTICRRPSGASGPWSHGTVDRLVQRAGRHHRNVRKLHGHLRPGTYRLTMRATDIHAKRSRVRRVVFSVIQ